MQTHDAKDVIIGLNVRSSPPSLLCLANNHVDVQVNLQDREHIWLSRTQRGSLVPALIAAGAKERDPRLARQNYELSAVIQKHHDSIPSANVAERRNFRNYAIGRTVATARANNGGR
jgi:hypothetical protein